ncbi:MAG: IMP dehydrogenase [Legionellales bacterium]|nr:IMP dehydrogenase [Legionellales bacterium]HBH10525.1 IMP dehydrogenase [Gammaproteobacteria bacterium]|tara:strand:+ start:2817 stop:4277 length:1461 start_codon:yes stop_codon:yes gene_type:complete
MNITEEALTFDDVLLVPDYSEILPRQASLETQLTREIKMNIPLVSAAMDTVTESELAIALAQEGGVGIIHKNMSPELQAKNVRRVKKYESGIIQEPVTVTPYTSIQEVIDLTRQKNISGVPVVDGDDLVGIVTSRDLRFEEKTDDPVRNIMTRKESLVTVQEHATKEEIRTLLHKHRIEKVLVVNNKFQLAGLITVKDMQKASEYPNACLDEAERLRVGAAVGVGEISKSRVEQLVESRVDVIVVDTAHGHSKGVLDMVKWIKTNFKDTEIIGGNIATADAALALVKAGADAVKVGIGPGSICTTRIVSGVGMPQVSAVTNVAKALKNKGIPVISDGGVRYSGDLAKGLAAGANSMMIGGLFAGTEEAPGEVELYQGRSYKTYRGMGSLGAMAEEYGSSDRYFQENDEVEKLIPEGIEGRVPYKGALDAVIHQLCGGIRAALGYTGCTNLEEMRDKAKFVRLTSAGFKESHVHDVAITKEPPNYRM